MSEPLELPIKFYKGMTARNTICVIFFLAVLLPSILWWKQGQHEPHLSFLAHLTWPFIVFLAIVWLPIALLITDDFADIVVNPKSITIAPVNIFWKAKKTAITRGMDQFDSIDFQITYGRGGPSCFIIFRAKSGYQDIQVDAPDEFVTSTSYGNHSAALCDYVTRLGLSVNLKVKENS